MGWYVEDYNLAQVTVNLNNYQVTPPHLLFEEVQKEAKKLNVAVTGSEIVGVIPLEAILMAAEYYIEKENLKKIFLFWMKIRRSGLPLNGWD